MYFSKFSDDQFYTGFVCTVAVNHTVKILTEIQGDDSPFLWGPKLRRNTEWKRGHNV